jgi:hypothetical protein
VFHDRTKRKMRFKGRPTLLFSIDLLTMFGAEAPVPRVVQDEAEFFAAAITSIRSHRRISTFYFNPAASIWGIQRIPDIEAALARYSRPMSRKASPEWG